MRKFSIFILLPIMISITLFGCSGGFYDNRPRYSEYETVEAVTAFPSDFLETAENSWPPGEYQVGVDFPSGDYFLYGDHGFASITTGINSIKHIYFGNFYFITLSENTKFFIRDANMIPVAQAPTIEPTNGYYASGRYRVGIDIPTGEYFFESIDKNDPVLAYVETDRELLLGERPNLGVWLPFFYYTADEEGTYLNVLGGRFILSEQAPVVDRSNDNGWYPEGMYLVGKDITAGKYILMPYDYDGYYIVLEHTKNPDHEGVLKRKFFKFRRTVKLEDGQYFYIERAAFKRLSGRV